MLLMYEEEPRPGVVYEHQGRYCYSCKWCSYGFSCGDEMLADAKADAHEVECELDPKARP